MAERQKVWVVPEAKGYPASSKTTRYGWRVLATDDIVFQFRGSWVYAEWWNWEGPDSVSAVVLNSNPKFKTMRDAIDYLTEVS